MKVSGETHEPFIESEIIHSKVIFLTFRSVNLKIRHTFARTPQAMLRPIATSRRRGFGADFTVALAPSVCTYQ
jgi:hypothetical protein